MGRILLWGIVLLIGLGFGIEAVHIHGARRDERAASRHAIRSPLADLSGRDAHALCAVFTPSARARVSDGLGTECETRLDEQWRNATPARIEARASCPQQAARAGC